MLTATKKVLYNTELMNYIYSFDPTYKNLYKKCIDKVIEISIVTIYKNICKNLIDTYIYNDFLLESYIFDRIIWMHDGYYNYDQWYGKNNIECVNCECIFIKQFSDEEILNKEQHGMCENNLINTSEQIYIEIIFNNVYYDPNNDIYTCDDYSWTPIKTKNSYINEYIEYRLDYDY